MDHSYMETSENKSSQEIYIKTINIRYQYCQNFNDISSSQPPDTRHQTIQFSVL